MLDTQNVESAWGTLCETRYFIVWDPIPWNTNVFDENWTEITQLLDDKCYAYGAHLDDLKNTE